MRQKFKAIAIAAIAAIGSASTAAEANMLIQLPSSSTGDATIVNGLSADGNTVVGTNYTTANNSPSTIYVPSAMPPPPSGMSQPNMLANSAGSTGVHHRLPRRRWTSFVVHRQPS